MMNKELNKINKENPFRVPEGYFEHFTERMMEQLPTKTEKKEIRLQPRRNYWRYAAAVVVVATVTSTGWWHMNRNNQEQVTAMNLPEIEMQEMYTGDYIDEALDYAMVDNMEIASYLTEAE